MVKCKYKFNGRTFPMDCLGNKCAVWDHKNSECKWWKYSGKGIKVSN